MKIDGVQKIELALNTAKPFAKATSTTGRKTVSNTLSANQVSFQGIIPAKIKKTGLSWITTISEFSARFDNDRWNIIITAIGTAIIAPLMIAKNPLVKNEDKDSKYYMALRQPISAVLAVAAQLGICRQSDNYIDKMARKGLLKNYDLSILQHPTLNETDVFDKLSTADKKVIEETIGRLKIFKDKVGILLALFTIPITCTILNWAHPRFIETFFPSIAMSKVTKKEAK